MRFEALARDTFLPKFLSYFKKKYWFYAVLERGIGIG